MTFFNHYRRVPTLEHTPRVRDQHHGERRKWQEVPWRNQMNDTLEWFPDFTCLKQPNQVKNAVALPVLHSLLYLICFVNRLVCSLQINYAKCQKKKRRKWEMGSNLHGFSLLLSLSLLPHPRCCRYVWLKALVVCVCFVHSAIPHLTSPGDAVSVSVCSHPWALEVALPC